MWIAALVWLLPSAVLAQTPPETIEYYALDAVGSVRVVFDASGTIIGRMEYGPFGQELFGGTHLPDRRYAGLFRDGEAGLDAAGARSYQSRTGRFSSVDPIYAGLFEPQRWNRYAYALNAPIDNLDPNGMLAFDVTVVGTMPPDIIQMFAPAWMTGLLNGAAPEPFGGYGRDLGARPKTTPTTSDTTSDEGEQQSPGNTSGSNPAAPAALNALQRARNKVTRPRLDARRQTLKASRLLIGSAPKEP